MASENCFPELDDPTSIESVQTVVIRGQLEIINTMRRVLCYGSLVGSAAAIAVLFESRLLWIVAIIIFGMSLLGTIIIHHLEFTTYGAPVAPFGLLFCFVVYSFPTIELEDLLRKIPILMVSFTFITVYSMPRLFPWMMPSKVKDIVPEDDRSTRYAEPGSTQTGEEYPIRPDPLANIVMHRLREQNLSHMGGASPLPRRYQYHGIESYLEDQVHSSTLDFNSIVSQNDAAAIGQTHGASSSTGNNAASSQPFQYREDIDVYSLSEDTSEAQDQLLLSTSSENLFLD